MSSPAGARRTRRPRLHGVIETRARGRFPLDRLDEREALAESEWGQRESPSGPSPRGNRRGPAATRRLDVFSGVHNVCGRSAVAFAWKQKGAYAAAFEEAMVSAHNAR